VSSTSSVASGSSSSQVHPWNASVASAAVRNLPASSSAGPASSNASSCIPGLWPIITTGRTPSGRRRGRASRSCALAPVPLALHAHRRTPEHGLRFGQACRAAVGGRAQHQDGLKLARLHVPGDRLRRLPAAPSQRPVVVGKLGVLPTMMIQPSPSATRTSLESSYRPTDYFIRSHPQESHVDSPARPEETVKRRPEQGGTSCGSAT
jgi:hypothetical protein